MSDLIAQCSQGVLSLTLNRPQKRNALSDDLITGLAGGLERATVDAEVRVVVIEGAGKDFCAGADLAELLASAHQGHEANVESALRLGMLFVQMRALPKPVVAKVHGRALAGGCGLATACDIVYAHADAQFGYSEVQRGFVPAMVMAMLRRCVGEKVAFELVARGRVFGATEAQHLGIVSRTFAAEDFADNTAKEIAALAQTSASAMALIKQQFYAIDRLAFEEAIRLGANVNAVARSGPDFAKAVSAFLDRK